MKIFVLNDQIVDHIDEFPLINYLKNNGFVVDYRGISNFKKIDHLRRHRLPLLHFKYLFSALQVLLDSKSGDYVICRLDYLAIYTKFLELFFLKKLVIIALNVMVNNQANFLKKKIFGLIFRLKNVFITVNSKGLIDYYCTLLKLKRRKIYLVYDACGKDILELEKSFEIGNKEIFCGGYNARDWRFIHSVAKQLPNYKFIFVGKRGFMNYLSILPNTKIYEEIPQNYFFQLMRDCSVIAIPLDTEAPAGLLVIYAASVLSKPVIITRTMTSIDFIEDKLEGRLIKKGDESSFIECLVELLDNEKLQEKYGNNLKNRIKNQCSISLFCDSILKIILELQYENSPNK